MYHKEAIFSSYENNSKTSKAPKPVGFGGKLLYSQERQQSQGNRQSAHEHIQDFGFIHKGYLLL